MNQPRNTVLFKAENTALDDYLKLKKFCMTYKITHATLLALMAKLIPVLERLAKENKIILSPKGDVELYV